MAFGRPRPKAASATAKMKRKVSCGAVGGCQVLGMGSKLVDSLGEQDLT